MSENEDMQEMELWDPLRSDAPELLENARYLALEPIYYGSNRCFLATIEADGAGPGLAVYKPGRGEYPLYDFPTGTLYLREVGSWLVDAMLGWQLIPPTVLSTGRFGPGSLQLFIDARASGQVSIVELQRLALLDIILNNADRKSDHCLLDDAGKLWAIDHGLTFHAHPKLRTVLWHFAGDVIPRQLMADIRRFFVCIEDTRPVEARRLRELLQADEWQALRRRTTRLIESGRFPDPRHKAVPYRW